MPVPKSDDMSDPTKWIGFNLIDIGSKVLSSILFQRLFCIIHKHGVKYQFGSTPGVGCQYGTLTIKTHLLMRNNHNLPMYVEFLDNVKAFNTVNHDLLMYILK